MSYNSRKLPSRKRKESESFYRSTSTKSLVQQAAVRRLVSGTNTKPIATTSSNQAEPKPASSNRLLAGYMAHEFLTKGTLFGQKFDPARAGAVPVKNSSIAELKRNNRQSQMSGAEAEPSGKPKVQGYAEVANLMKTDGAHIPGVVNPTQLARWIQM